MAERKIGFASTDTNAVVDQLDQKLAKNSGSKSQEQFPHQRSESNPKEPSEHERVEEHRLYKFLVAVVKSVPSQAISLIVFMLCLAVADRVGP